MLLSIFPNDLGSGMQCTVSKAGEESRVTSSAPQQGQWAEGRGDPSFWRSCSPIQSTVLPVITQALKDQTTRAFGERKY